MLCSVGVSHAMFASFAFTADMFTTDTTSLATSTEVLTTHSITLATTTTANEDHNKEVQPSLKSSPLTTSMVAKSDDFQAVDNPTLLTTISTRLADSTTLTKDVDKLAELIQTAWLKSRTDDESGAELSSCSRCCRWTCELVSCPVHLRASGLMVEDFEDEADVTSLFEPAVTIFEPNDEEVKKINPLHDPLFCLKALTQHQRP